MEPEGEETTMAPEDEEKMEYKKEKNEDYKNLHRDHTMLLPPNADCNATKTGITDEEKDFILKFHNELRSKVSCTHTFNSTYPLRHNQIINVQVVRIFQLFIVFLDYF